MNPSESLASLLLSLGGFIGLIVLTWNAFDTNMQFLVAGGVIALIGIIGLLVVGHRTWTREHRFDGVGRFPGDSAAVAPWTGDDLPAGKAVIIPPDPTLTDTQEIPPRDSGKR